MLNDLDASGFDQAPDFYAGEFECILAGIVYCYQIMLNDKIMVPNEENTIRDILLTNYLKKRSIRDRVGFTGKYNFDREVPEANDEGRTDIKVMTRDTFIEQDAYYIIECKRLDNKNLIGNSGLNAKYISEGIMRFVSRKYSAFYAINGMIGFVVKRMEIGANIANINWLLQNHFADANTILPLTNTSFIKNFDFQYYSKHSDIVNKQLKIYHLMFDFSSNLNEIIQ